MNYKLFYLYIFHGIGARIFGYLYLFCAQTINVYIRMNDFLLPFRLTCDCHHALQPVHEGQIISTLDQCGLFLCSKGEIVISFEDKTYHVRQGDMYIYMASTLIRLLHKSDDVEGIMVEVDLDFIIPVVNKAVNVESLLFMREHPCISLPEKQSAHLEQLLRRLSDRIEAEQTACRMQQNRTLKLELIKSMGQTLCYEVLDAYFSTRPLNPLPQSKKDLVFQNFMVALFRFYRRERDVAFYARRQHLAPRYFSTIIKEKSGSSALQWIVQMVITEAKQLLENSDLSIKEIAAQLNFPTQSFFGKYFKQYVGKSPKEYRRDALG